MEIWVNPACSKCRSAVSILDEAGVAYTVRRYLDDPPSAAELRDVLARLGLEPWDITRTNENDDTARELADWPRDEASRARWIELLASHPKLIQRPIIIADSEGASANASVAGGGGTAVVGRSDEAVRSVLP